jgi:MFS family permease
MVLSMSSSPPGRYPPSFFIAMLSSTLFLFSYQAFFPVLPIYAHDIGAGDAGWGLAFSVTAWVAVALRLLGGPLTDRLGRRVVMAFGGLFLVAGGLIYWATADFWGLLVGRACHGVAIGTFTTSYKALIVDLAPEARRGEAVGLGNLTFGLALIFAPPLGEYIQSRFGYGPTFLFGAAVALLCVLVVGFIRVTGYTPSSHSLLAGIREAFPRRTTQIGIWGMLSFGALFVSVMTFLPLLADSRGITGVGFAFSVYALMELLGQPLGGRLGDRLGRRLVVVIGLCVGALGELLFLFAGTRLMLYLGAGFVGFGVAATRVSLDTIVVEGAPHALRGTSVGLEYGSGDTWIALGSWSLGFIADRTGYSTIYTIMMIVPLLLVFLMWFMIPANLGRLAGRAASESAADR